MIPNKNEIVNITTEKDSNGNQILSSKSSYYKQPFYQTMFLTDKEYVSYIKSIEKLVRKSKEYSAYVGYLKNTYELDNDTFFKNINHDMASIEFHHYPFTLYDIVVAVVEKMISDKEPVSTFLVAKKIMELHFNNKIGLVPLSITTHQLVHAGELFISLKQVYGYFNEFIDEYGKYISIETANNYNKLVEKTKELKEYNKIKILEY